MRIMIFAAGGDIGGGKTHILSLANELAKCNDLRLVCFRKGVMSEEGEAMGLDVAAIDHSEGTPAAIRFALAQVDEFEPEVIHCHGSKANMIGALVKKKRGIPVMSTVHSDPKLDYMGRPLRALTFGKINMWALRRMDYYVAVAWKMRETLIEYGFDPQSIFTVYNGMDFSDAPKGPRPRKAEDEEIVIGIAARLNPVKDIPTLIRAFAKAFKEDKRLRLSIAGTGEAEAELKTLVKELGVEEYVTFEGWISDIKAYFGKVDINVLSSLSETFPYSLLEGAYQHIPAIATTVGGIPSLIEHGKTGYLFEPGDADAFADYILKLAADPDLREQLAEALFEKASAEFSLDRMRRDQENIYRTLLRRYEHRGERGGAVLCGAYGRGNAGDEAILKAILQRLRSIDPDMPIWVMSRNPLQTSKKESVRSFYIFNVFAFLKALKQADLFVNGGGSLIQDVTSSRSLYFYLFTLKAAKRCGCRIVMYGCGIGPINKAANRKKAGKVLDSTADIITLRDSVSHELLQEMGVTRPEIVRAADPVLSLAQAPENKVAQGFAAEGIPEGLNMAGFCLRSWPEFKNKQAVADAARYCYEKYGLTPVFFPIEEPKDVPVGQEIAAMLNCPCYVCSKRHSSDEIIGMLGRMKLVCGMRLHSLIFATAAGAPVIGISYDVKVDSFIKDIGSSSCISVTDLNTEKLEKLIDERLAAGEADALAKRDQLKELEGLNGRAAARLLRKEEA